MGSRLLQAVVIILISMLLMYIGWPLFDSLGASLMAENIKRVSYETGADDDSEAIYGSNWCYQTFTATSDFSLTSVRLLLYATGTPGAVTAYVETVAGGEPSDTIIATGSILGTTIPTTSTGTWTTITTSAYDILDGVQYAIVLACSGSSTSCVYWKIDCTTPGYTGGKFGYSTDSGSTWTDGSLCSSCITYTITATETNETGHMSPTGVDIYTAGQNAVYTISGLVFPFGIDSIEVDGIAITSGVIYSWGTSVFNAVSGTIIFSNIADDHTLEVIYVIPA